MAAVATLHWRLSSWHWLVRIATTRSSLVCHSSSLHQSLNRPPSKCLCSTLLLTNCKPLLLLLLNSWTRHTLSWLGRTSFQVRAALTGGAAWVSPYLQPTQNSTNSYLAKKETLFHWRVDRPGSGAPSAERKCHCRAAPPPAATQPPPCYPAGKCPATASREQLSDNPDFATGGPATPTSGSNGAMGTPSSGQGGEKGRGRNPRNTVSPKV